MAKRTPTKIRKDHKVFTNTAKKTKKINVQPKISRGGICLWLLNYTESEDY